MMNAFLRAELPSQRVLEGVRTAFLLFNLVGFIMYPVELYFLGHWLDSFASKIPFLVAAPGFVLTLAILFDRRTPWLRTAFIVMMVIVAVTGAAGSAIHLYLNFEGEVAWTFEKTAEALSSGARPVMAALAFTHIGVTGLLCMYRAR